MRPTDLLEQRGILEPAQSAGWSENGTGWKYPCYRSNGEPLTTLDGQPILRWKAYDSSQKPKYLWMPSQLGDAKPRYYLIPGTKEAIIKADGMLYLASGEPDNLAFRAAGVQNVLNWFGENQTPETLANDLQLLGVQAIQCWPDLDDTGQLWAKSIYERLANTFITFTAYRLPGEMGSAYDINKHWMACNFNADKFWESLALLPELKFHIEAKPLFGSSPSTDEFSPAFIEAIEHRLGVTAYKPNGYSKEIACPMKHHEHDDKSPAAGWSHEKQHLKCFKCNESGQIYLAKDVAAQLGIDWRDFIPKQVAVTQPIAKSKPSLQVIQTWDESSDKVLAELEGKFEVNAREPLPMLFNAIRQFGGLAKALPAGMVIGVAADTGDGKTSCVETLVDYWRKRGFSGMGWSPEWLAINQVYRAIQRHGGPSLIDAIEHKGWQLEAMRNIPPEKRSGKPLSDEMVAIAKEKLAYIKSWPGKYTIIDKMGLSVEEIIVYMQEVVDKKSIYGERMAFVVLDYAQLLNTAGEKAADRIERATAQFKTFCVDNSLTGIITSQVNKEAGRQAAKGESLDTNDLQNLRGDYLNLLITLAREKMEGTGQKSKFAKGNVSKNSLGRNGEFRLELDEDRMKWIDPREPDLAKAG